MEQNKNKIFRSGTSKKGLLASKIKSANCGGIMTIIYGVNKNIHYYKCRNKIASRKSICDIKNINGINADKEIIGFLMDLTNDNDKLLAAINSKKGFLSMV